MATNKNPLEEEELKKATGIQTLPTYTDKTRQHVSRWGDVRETPYYANDAMADEFWLSPEDYERVNTYQNQWADAYNAGDQVGMDAAHAAAEAIRSQYGYLGGADGNEYNVIPQEEIWATTGGAKPIYSWNGERPEFQSDYMTDINAKLDAILNRDAFSYNVETDPLYQQYAKMYNREGTRAMNDTMATAASNAGGMNSYAMTAAQQANDYYAAQLGDKIPELYQMAYDMYLQDLDNQVRDLGLLQDMDETQYSRYRDTMSDWEDDRNFAYNKYRDDVGDWQWDKSFSYNAYRDSVNDAYRDQEWEYGVSRDQVADSRYESENAYERAMQMLLQGIMPDSSLLTQAGISSSVANALKTANTPKVVYTGGPGTEPTEPEEEEGEYKYKVEMSNPGTGYNPNPAAREENVEIMPSKLQQAVINAGLSGARESAIGDMLYWGVLVENKDGSFSWKDGWSGSNWKQKYAARKKIESGSYDTPKN